MEPKTGKESRSCDDITLISEIITNSRYWQDDRGRGGSPLPALRTVHAVLPHTALQSVVSSSGLARQ